MIVVAVGLLIAGWLGRLIQGRLRHYAQDRIAADILGRMARIMLLVGVILLGLHAAGLSGVAAAIFTTLGASTLILGFAFKDIGENFLAGLILAFSRPFNVGDTVSIEGHFGKVRALNFRYTHLKDFDGKDVFVPNGKVLNNAVINFTQDGFIRQEFSVGIAYEDDIDAAIALVKREVDAFPGILDTATHHSFACVDELATSTINIKVRFWMETSNYRSDALKTRGQFMRVIKEALAAEGFSLPADIIELKLYGSEKSIPVELMGNRSVQSTL